MSEYNFTEAGYIEVYCGDRLVSKHKQEREAIEAILSDSIINNVEAVYILKKPSVKVVYRPKSTGIISGSPYFATT